MVEVARHIDEIDPAECRRAVEDRFGSDAFVVAHEEAYRRLLGDAPPQESGAASA